METTNASKSSVSDLVRRYFLAYQSKDRGLLDSLVSEDFTFTSPYDDRINRAVYFERCWPNSKTIAGFTIEKLFEQGNEAFVTYLGEPVSGARFRNTEHFTIEGGKIKEVVVYFGSLPTEAAKDSDAPIRALIDERIKAVHDKDVARAMANTADDVVSFDVVDPLRYVGIASATKRTKDWFSSFEGGIGFEIRDLRIAVQGGVAFSHSLNRYSATRVDGGAIDMWVRSTACYQKIQGKWMITHEHGSVPFDPASGKASMGLKP